MSKNLYKENCLEYLQKGYSVIPDGYMKKRPLIKGWADYCVAMPPEELVREWGHSYTQSNIAVCLGEASGIVALDLDCIDPEILEVLEPLLPPSPCEKVGSKGYTRFFRYRGESTTVIKINGDVVLELLSKGKKTTIPPSVHPNGNEYRWAGKSLLEVDKEDLPILPPALFPHIEMMLQKCEMNVYDHKKIKTGRTLALGAKASEYIALRKDLSSAVSDLVIYDRENHDKPLFTDPVENQGITVAYLNALRFYADYLKSINAKRVKEGKDLELPLTALTPTKPFNSNSLKNEKEIVNLPEATGLIKDIRDYILARSYVEQPVFATSAAMSLIGTLIGRSVVFQGTTPNMFILNIGPSGSGKDSCQQSLKDILMAVNKESLLGATTYPSEASIIANLAATPVRLDIIDEASSFLKSASGMGASYAMGIGDTLCELFSCSNSKYLGKVLSSMQGNKVGECYRPHLNLLCSTTYKGMAEGLSRSTLEKGLFARFLVFFGDESRRGKRVTQQPTIGQDMRDKLEYISRFENPYATGNLKGNNPPLEVTVTEEADKLLTKYHEMFDIKRISEGSDSIVRPIVARLYQHMMKMCLVSAVGNMKVDGIPKIGVHDVEFAYGMVNFYYQSIEGFVNDNLYDSHRGNKVNTILRLIKDKGSEGLKSSDLTKMTKSTTMSERNEIIKDLVHSAQISVEPDTESDGVIFKELA